MRESKDQLVLVVAIFILFFDGFISWTPMAWVVLMGSIAILMLWYMKGVGYE